MKKQLVKLILTLTPILLVSNFCSSAKADFGMTYAQNSIDMMTTVVNNRNNEMMVEQNNRSRRSNTDSTLSGGNNKQDSSSKGKTTFDSDPNITKEVQNSFVRKMDDPLGKKFLTFLLTPKNAKKIFRDFHPEERFQFNDIVDVFTIASLYSFMTIEDKENVNKQQIQSTRQRFRQFFSKRSLDNSTLQRSSEGLLYWTMLIAFNQSQSKGNSGDTQSTTKVKSRASELMTTLGLNPEKYTLGSRGFVAK
jgi:hypothetical protein